MICPTGEDAAPLHDALHAASGVAAAHVAFLTAGNGPLPAGCDGLFLAGGRGFSRADAVPQPLLAAISRDIPILGIGWGMHAINVAFGGMPPEASPGHGPSPDGGALKNPVFLSPGGKVSFTIGGSGWVNVPCAHAHGIRDAGRAPEMLATAYAQDGVVEAIERPGRHWVIGVQWRAHAPREIPRGFDNVLLAFLERAAGI